MDLPDWILRKVQLNWHRLAQKPEEAKRLIATYRNNGNQLFQVNQTAFYISIEHPLETITYAFDLTVSHTEWWSYFPFPWLWVQPCGPIWLTEYHMTSHPGPWSQLLLFSLLYITVVFYEKNMSRIVHLIQRWIRYTWNKNQPNPSRVNKPN